MARLLQAQQRDDSGRRPGCGTWADEPQPDSRLLRSESVLPHEPQRRHHRRPPAPGPAVHSDHPILVRVAGPKEAAHGVERRGGEALDPGVLCPEAGLLEGPPVIEPPRVKNATVASM